MIKKFEKRPLIVEAVFWDGKPTTLEEIEAWSKMGITGSAYLPLTLKTNRGKVKCFIGDWLIKGVRGEFYPVRYDIFSESYKEVNNV